MEASMLHHMAQDDFDMHQTCYHNKLATITNVAQLHPVDLWHVMGATYHV